MTDPEPRRIDEALLWFHARPTTFTIEHGLTQISISRHADAARGERPLGAFILPPYQRPPVWTVAQQIRLIESFWIGLPVGSYVVNEDDDGISPTYAYDRWLLDGQQRWAATIAYVNDAFPVFGWKFSQLSGPETARFRRFTFPGYVTRVSKIDQADALDRLLDIYSRLAYGGTPHA